MSKAEILAELPKLSPQERDEILERLCLLDEASGPSSREKAMLDEAQAEYEANPNAGESWPSVEARLRRR